jgi:excisionase family DNA binding protein
MNLEISITCHSCATVIARGQLTTQACPHVREIGNRTSLVSGPGRPAGRDGDLHGHPESGQPCGARVAAYTVEQVADMLTIGRDKVYYLLRTGQLRSLKIGKLRRITNAHLDEFLTAAEDAHR